MARGSAVEADAFDDVDEYDAETASLHPVGRTGSSGQSSQGGGVAASLGLATMGSTAARAVVSEVVGAMIYTLLGFGGVVASSAVSSPFGVITVPRVLLMAFSFGLAATASSLSSLYYGGGHFNPAITLGALMTKSIGTLPAVSFVVAQIVGCLLGAVLIMACVPPDLWKDVTGPAAGEGITMGSSLASEVVSSFALTYVVLSVMIEFAKTRASYPGGHHSPLVPVARGCIEITSHILVGGLSGGVCNPAVSLAMAAVTGDWDAQWLYWVGPLIGTFFASAIVNAINKVPRR